MKEVGEWRRQEEPNNSLRRRFEESRQELERVLKKAQGCLKETGDAEELLKKHTVRSKLCLSLHAHERTILSVVQNIGVSEFVLVNQEFIKCRNQHKQSQLH